MFDNKNNQQNLLNDASKVSFDLHPLMEMVICYLSLSKQFLFY